LKNPALIELRFPFTPIKETENSKINSGFEKLIKEGQLKLVQSDFGLRVCVSETFEELCLLLSFLILASN
jgi:hypothetical protein